MFSNQMNWLRPEASQRSASAGFGVRRETNQLAVEGSLVAINRTTNLLSMSRLQRQEIRSKRLRRLALLLLKAFLVRLKFVFGYYLLNFANQNPADTLRGFSGV
jgi:hypothetical protein